MLWLSQPKAACHPGRASFPFASLLIPELNRQKTKPAEKKGKGITFAWPKSLRQLAAGIRCAPGHGQDWEQERGRGTSPAQRQPAIYVKPQPETLNITLKPLVVWKQIRLCF